MRHINHCDYLNAEEAAAHLGMTVDELTTFTLESDRPEYILAGDVVFYLATDVERLKPSVLA